MQSFMDSPLYQRMMAQALQGNVSHTRNAVGALGDVVGNLADAWAAKQYGDKLEKRDQAVGKTYSDAFAPQVYPTLLASQIDDQTPGSPENQPTTQPTSQQSLAKLLSNPDIAAQLGPSMAGALVQNQARANEPNTPYQNAQIARQARLDSPDYQGKIKALPGPPEQPKPQSVVDQDMALKAAPGPAPQPTAGMSQEAFTQAKALAQIKADIAAQTQGEFGRSMQGKAYNILAAGLTNPAARSTPEYATAWQILSNPRVDPNTGTIVTPDLSAFAPPGSGSAPQGQPGAPGTPPPQRMPSVQSFAPPNPSQPEAASAGYANRLSSSADVIDKNQGAGASMYNRAASSLPGGNYLVGGDYQQLDQAERNFVNAQLRRESGAAISESEFSNARKQYLPQPGDGPEVLKQKKAARDMAVRNMQLSAGNTLMPPGVIQQSSPGKGAPVVPMEQGFGQPQQQAAPSGVTEEDIQHTLKLHPEVTRAQLLQKLGGR